MYAYLTELAVSRSLGWPNDGQESHTRSKIQSEATIGFAMNRTKASGGVGALDGGDRLAFWTHNGQHKKPPGVAQWFGVMLSSWARFAT